MPALTVALIKNLNQIIITTLHHNIVHEKVVAVQAAERAIPEPRTGVNAGMQPAAARSVPPIQAGRANGAPVQPAILSEQQIRMEPAP